MYFFTLDYFIFYILVFIKKKSYTENFIVLFVRMIRLDELNEKITKTYTFRRRNVYVLVIFNNPSCRFVLAPLVN